MKVTPEQALTGIGLGIAASVLLPLIKPAMDPAVSMGKAGAIAASNEVRKRLGLAREGFEDFLAEVQFERFKSHIDKEMMGGETNGNDG